MKQDDEAPSTVVASIQAIDPVPIQNMYFASPNLRQLGQGPE